jgi:hypothetical protein
LGGEEDDLEAGRKHLLKSLAAVLVTSFARVRASHWGVVRPYATAARKARDGWRIRDWAGVMLLASTSIVVIGCAGNSNHTVRSGARLLTAAELDRITMGDARAMSDAAAYAAGAHSVTSALSAGLASAGGSLLSEAPVIDYAVSESQGSAYGATWVQANSSGKIFVSSSDSSAVGANAASFAQAAGEGGRAATKLQLYGVSTTNNTHLAFGTVSAVACCAPGDVARTEVDIATTGQYSYAQEAQRINTDPRVNNVTIDFVAVSSSVPVRIPTQSGQ